jgi:hypothetical protein
VRRSWELVGEGGLLGWGRVIEGGGEVCGSTILVYPDFVTDTV